MAIYIWVNIGPSNGLLPAGTKPLPERMLTYNQSDDVRSRVISQEIAQPLMTEIDLKMTYLIFHLNLRRAMS